MLFLFAANVTPPPAAPRHAIAQSSATVTIERPAIANHDRWEHASAAERREIIVRDERGRPVLLRLIEYQ